MFYANPQDTFSLLSSIQYTHTQNTTYDYSKEPRPCHNFVFMLEGSALVESDGETYRMQAGDILFIPKNTTYLARWIAEPKAVFHSLHFSFHPKNDPLFNKNIPVQLLPNEDFERLYAHLKWIEEKQFSKNVDSFLVLSAFYAICGTLLTKAKINPVKTVNKTLSPALLYIQQNYAAQIEVETLAALCFLSPSRFHFLFKQQLGTSPIVYKNQLAIQHTAQDLLYNKEVSIREISEKHGFSSMIYFERLFKKIMGKTPSAYRKENTLL